MKMLKVRKNVIINAEAISSVSVQKSIIGYDGTVHYYLAFSLNGGKNGAESYFSKDKNDLYRLFNDINSFLISNKTMMDITTDTVWRIVDGKPLMSGAGEP